MRRTYQTHAVQQAFGISPDNVHTIAIRGLNVSIEPGNVVLILGPSGSGKTSLLQLLCNEEGRLDMLVEGEVRLPRDFRPETFQGIRSRKPIVDALGEKDVRSALYLLGLAGLSEPTLYLKRFQELSKGQQYRAMLSKLIATRSNVWVADEFCANLDPATASVVADNVQRIARRLGITVIAAAPHCDTFLHSLRPDLVVLLGSSWDHSTFRGKDYMKAMRHPVGLTGNIPLIRVWPELIESLKRGVKKSTIRSGRLSITPGLLLLSDGKETMAVRVRSSVCKRFSRLSNDDAKAEGVDDAAALKKLVRGKYPELQERSLVTVVHFEPLLNFESASVTGYTDSYERPQT